MRFNILKKVNGSGSTAPKNKFAYLAHINDIRSFPKADYKGVALVDDILMKEKTGMSQIYITPAAQEYTYDTAGDSDSKNFKLKFSGTHPGTEQEALEFAKNYLEEGFVVLIPSCNVGLKVLGTPDAPLVFTSSHKSDKDSQKFIFTFEQEIGTENVYQIYTGLVTLNENIDVDMGDFLEHLKNYLKLDGSNLSEAQKQNLRTILGSDGKNLGNNDLSLNGNRSLNLGSYFLNFFSSAGAKIGINKNNPTQALEVVGNIKTDGIVISDGGSPDDVGSVKRNGNEIQFKTSEGWETVMLKGDYVSDSHGIISPDTPVPVGGWKIGWYTPKLSSPLPGTNYPNQNDLKSVDKTLTKFYFDGNVWESAVKNIALGEELFLKKDENSIITEVDFSYIVKEYGYIRFSDGKKPNTTDTNWIGNAGLIGVTEGQEISYKFAIEPTVAGIAAYDINRNYLQNESIEGLGQIEGIYIVPSEVRFVKFSYSTGSPAIINFDSEIIVDGENSVKVLNNIVKSFDEKISTNIQDINEIKSKLYSQSTNNIFDIVEVFKGYQTVAGHINGLDSDANWFNSEFVEVIQNTDIVAKKLGGQASDVMTIGFFDASFNCLTSESVKVEINTTLTKTITNPAIKYVRFSGTMANIISGIASVEMAYVDRAVNFSNRITVNEQDIESLKTADLSIVSRLADLENSANPIKWKHDVNHFIHYGQSLSQADWENLIISAVQKYNAVMFTGTPRVWEYRDQINKYNSLIPLVENVFEYQPGETVVGAYYRGETPCAGTAEKLMQLISDEDNFDYDTYDWKVLLSAPGMGGTGIGALSDPDGIFYQRLLADVVAGKNLANAAGKSYACQAVSWIQGEADNWIGASESSYYNSMFSLFDNLNTDIKTITGQIEDVNIFLYQTDCCHFYGPAGDSYRYPHISLAQLRIAREKPNVHIATPIYHLPKIGDFVHFSAVGSKWFGGYFGIAYKRVLIDNKKDNYLYIKEAFVQGNNIFVVFNVPELPLVIDTVNQIDRGVGKGFQIREIADFDDNSYLDIITGVSLIRPDMIKISCNADPAGKKLTYAVSNANSYGVTSQYIGGNVRDSQDIKFDFKESISATSETSHDMYNWLPISEFIL